MSLGLIKTSDRALKKILAVTEEGRHVVVVMDGAGWHTEEIANDFKCQCHQTSTLFSRAKPYPDKYGVGCGNAI